MKNSFSILSTKILKPYIKQQLEEFDFVVLEHDFIKIEKIPIVDFQESVKSGAGNYIFTSKNAVRFFVEEIEHRKIKINQKICKLFCLAGETLLALEDEGFKACSIAQNATDLAKKIIEDGAIKEAVFFCGDKRKDDLPLKLQEAEIKVHQIVLYKNILQPKPVEASYQVVLFFSPSAVRSFFENNSLPKSVACFCIGHTTAKELKAYKLSNKIMVCGFPAQQNMIDEVLQYFNIKN